MQTIAILGRVVFGVRSDLGSLTLAGSVWGVGQRSRDIAFFGELAFVFGEEVLVQVHGAEFDFLQ
jgi:hypothetical protein